MTSRHWQRVSRLFDAALALDPEARAMFLEMECQGDSDLRRELDSLLNQQVEFLSGVPSAGGVFTGMSRRRLIGVQLWGFPPHTMTGQEAKALGSTGPCHRIARRPRIQVLHSVF